MWFVFVDGCIGACVDVRGGGEGIYIDKKGAITQLLHSASCDIAKYYPREDDI